MRHKQLLDRTSKVPLTRAPTGSLRGWGLSCRVFFPRWFCQVRQ